MISRKELLSDPDYWFEEAQNELYRQVHDYLKSENITQTELATRLGVSKGYVSQILKGNFNYTLKKLIDISISLGLAPKITYTPIDSILSEDLVV